MKKRLFLGACLVALASQLVEAQTVAPAVAVVIIKYEGDGPGLGHLMIDREGKIERKNVLNATFGNAVPVEDVLLARAKILRQTVAQLYQEGYVLKASLAHTVDDELIFVKEK